MEEGRMLSKFITGKPTGKRPLGRPRWRWKDNIRQQYEGLGLFGSESVLLKGPCEGYIEPPVP